MEKTKVISLGGSIVAPDQVDVDFLRQFRKLIVDYLKERGDHKLILVVGGGGPARAYQHAYRKIIDEASDNEADWIGIGATRLNGQLLAGVFSGLCVDPVATDPTAVSSFRGRILVAAGWKPGFSTDFDAVLLAERFGGDTIVNLSNIARVYTADPKLDPTAQPIERATWAQFRAIVGDRWEPGKNAPFDPIASKRAAELGLRVIVAAGREIENLKAILNDKAFVGTVIGPQ
jgi:uridylate kinase